MDLDDLDPRKPKIVSKDLGLYSVEELKSYVQMLEAEITRAKEAIAKKQSHKSAADQFFKT